jgi:hypothetical protein
MEGGGVLRCAAALKMLEFFALYEGRSQDWINV